MVTKKVLIASAYNAIQRMSIEDLHKYPDLESLIPLLHESITTDDDCSHSFVNGECICGLREVDKDIKDNGPWNVYEGANNVYLQSDDFTFDASLKVTGDFISRTQKYAYAKMLADKLNG